MTNRITAVLATLLCTLCATAQSAMQQKVWRTYCKQQATTDTLATFSFAPVTQGNTMAWHLPEQMEPHATMHFYSGTKGAQPSTGYPLFLYLHGSGPSQMEWQTGLQLAQRFEDSPSAYIIPRIPNEGQWYRWWQQSKQWAWEHMLRKLLTDERIDPERIYMFGISEGGYGSQRLASYYADYLAAAGPMAGGEPLKNAPVENLSHIGFSLLTGDRDQMFYRNMLTHTTGQALDSIARLYPTEYQHRVQLIPDRGHAIDYSPTTPWLSQFRRQAQPHHFQWENMEVDGRKRNAFYNLEVLRETDAYRTNYEFLVQDNDIQLTVSRVAYETTWIDPNWSIDMLFARHLSPAEHGQLRVYLSPQLVDPKQPITININGQRVWSGKVKASRKTVQRACQLWGDPLRLFPYAVEVEW